MKEDGEEGRDRDRDGILFTMVVADMEDIICNLNLTRHHQICLITLTRGHKMR